MVPYNQRLQSYVSKSIDKLFRTIQFRQGVRRVIGTASLEDLSNVSGATPTDGEVLEWSQTQGLWIPGDGGGEGTIPNLQSVMGEGSTATGLTSTVQVSTSGSIILNSPGFTYEFGTSNPTTGESANIQIGSGAGLDMYTFSGTSNDDFYSSLGFASGNGQINLFTEGSNPGANRAELTLNKTTGVELRYINNKIAIDASNMTVTDSTVTPKGLVYGGAYKDNFTTYSLVDKDYVDTEIAGIGTPTLQQVMGEGATYSGTNTFSMASAKSSIIDQGFNLAIGHSNGTGDQSLTTMAGSSLWNLSSGASGTAELVLDADASVKLNWKDGVAKSEILIDGTQMLVTDANNTKGLEYAGAYKANFTQYSLVDKDYVDTQISGISGVSATHVPVMNAAGTSYIDSPLISDGTTVGLNTSLWSGSLFNANTNGTEVYVMNVSRSTSASAGERTTMLVDAGSGGATNDNISLRASATIGAAGSNSVALQGVSRGILSPSAAGITDASIGVYGYAGNGSANSSNEAIGGLFAAAVADGGLPIGVYSTTYGGAGTAEVKLFYGTTSVSNSADNIGMKINVSNSGSGSAYSLQLIDGTQGANKFLKSDANGKASWADVPAGGATSIGELSDAITDVEDNIGLGSGALASIGTTALTNTALGIDAGTSLTTGDRNLFVGNYAAQNFTTANDCVAIGNNAMGTGTGQSTNIAIGSSALVSVRGVGNIGIGNSAGSSITTGGRNILIGRNAQGLNTSSYQIAIGDLSTTQASSLALGRSGRILLHGEFATADRTKLGVNLGNTYSAPTANLQVKGNASDTTTFLVQNGAGSSILQANQNGNIGIGTTAPQEKLHISTGNDLNSGDISFLIGGTAGTNARTGRIIKNTSSSYEMTIRASDFATGSNLLLNDTGGNVGVGTTSPAEALDISGNVKVGGQAYSATHTLTAAASVAPDFDNSNVQTVTLDQATTLANPTNLKDGATYIVIVKQPAGANHTLAFGTAYKFEGGTDPTITAANGATDVLTFVSDGTNLYGAAALNFS